MHAERQEAMLSDGLTGAGVLRFVHVATVIAVAAAAERGGLGDGEAVRGALLAQPRPLEGLEGPLRTSWEEGGVITVASWCWRDDYMFLCLNLSFTTYLIRLFCGYSGGHDGETDRDFCAVDIQTSVVI